MNEAADPLAGRPAGLAVVCALTALAGAADACGLARLKDLFVSFMSGNTTSLGVALGGGDWSRAGLIAGLVALFVSGAALGEILAVASGRWRLPVVTVAVTAGLVAAAAAPAATAAALTLSMGALNAAISRAGGVTVSITFVTGALVRLGQGFGKMLCGQGAGAWGWLRHGAPWLGLLAGAAGATALQGRGIDPLRVLPGCAAAIAAVAWWLER
jgi:uncharacterized membrane protein YoaK (UPF0700 family)